MSSRTDVVVVGAGPTGMTAAGLLARRGLDVTVLERHREPYELPRAVHFDDEVLRVFSRMGLGQQVRAVSTPGLGMRLLDAQRRVLLELPRDASGGVDGLPGASMFHQPDLERVLRDDLARCDGVQVRTGTDVVGTRQVSDEEVRVTLADGTDVRARAVLACDGAASAVRQRLGVSLRSLGESRTWLVVDVRTTGEVDEWRGVLQVCDPRRPTTFMRVGPRRYRLELAVLPGESAAALTSPGTLARHAASWLGPADTWQVLRATTYTYGARVADRWRVGRTFLLGDAAHQTPPFLGQGMCAGIRDAANLEWKLAAVLDGSLGEDVLDTYEIERRPHAMHVIRVAAALGVVMTRGGPVTSALRSAVLRTAGAVPGLPERITAHAWPALTPGPMVHRPRPVLASAVGRLVPTPLVATLDGVERLDSLLGNGFTHLRLGAAGQAPAGVRSWRVVTGRPAASGELSSDRLTDWLRRHHAHEVLLRPDRVVAQQR